MSDEEKRLLSYELSCGTTNLLKHISKNELKSKNLDLDSVAEREKILNSVEPFRLDFFKVN